MKSTLFKVLFFNLEMPFYILVLSFPNQQYPSNANTHIIKTNKNTKNIKTVRNVNKKLDIQKKEKVIKTKEKSHIIEINNKVRYTKKKWKRKNIL